MYIYIYTRYIYISVSYIRSFYLVSSSRFGFDAPKIYRPAFRELTFQFIITNGGEHANNSISASVDGGEEKAQGLLNHYVIETRIVPWWWWYFVHRAHASPRCPAPGKNNRSYPNHRHNTEKKPKTDVLVRYFYPRLRTSANSIKIPTKFYLPTLHGLSNVIIIYLVSFSFIIYIYISSKREKRIDFNTANAFYTPLRK